MATTEKTNKLPEYLHDRVLVAKITRMEGALLNELRKLSYGEITLLVVKFDNEPVRIEIERMKQSKNLQARDGLELEDAVIMDEVGEKVMQDNQQWLKSKRVS